MQSIMNNTIVEIKRVNSNREPRDDHPVSDELALHPVCLLRLGITVHPTQGGDVPGLHAAAVSPTASFLHWSKFAASD